MQRLSEIALIAQVVTLGSRRAFDQLVREHQEAVRRFLRRLTNGDEMLADDLAQETFIRAWQGLKGFRGGSSFETWVMRIAYRVFLDEAKSPTAHPQPLPEEGSTNGRRAVGDEAVESDSFALRHDLQLAMATLSEAERTCVSLQCIEGQSIRDIASITGMPENTVKSHLLRGKKNLANYLRRNGYNGK